MGLLRNKHRNAQRIFYSGFDGGLNLAIPSESMPRNELKEARNVEYSHLTGALRVRGGLVWSGRFNYDVEDIIPVKGRRGFLARLRSSRLAYYFRWNNIWNVNGIITGIDELRAATWGKAGELVVASGGRLQKFSDDVLPTLTTIAGAPNECRDVFVRNGRVGVVTGDDTIMFSAVGDCENWTNDPNDESSSQYLEVGYKDGMKITAIVPLSKDLIIFKAPIEEPDKGTIWRLTGEFPDWQLLEVAHNTGTFGPKSVAAIGNDIYYVTISGIASLSSVTAYGEVKTSWPDRKVSNGLTPMIDNTAQIWDIPVKQQVWVQPSKNEKTIWVFDYSLGIWTQFEFPQNPIYAAGVDNRLYVFIGWEIYEVNDWYTQDEIHGTSPRAITASIKLGSLISGRQTLIKGAMASFDIMPECRAELILGKFKMPFSYGGTIDYIYDPPNDTQYASEDDDPLFPEGGVLTSRRQCIVRDWAIQPEVKIYGGGCSLSTMGLETAEV